MRLLTRIFKGSGLWCCVNISLVKYTGFLCSENFQVGLYMKPLLHARPMDEPLYQGWSLARGMLQFPLPVLKCFLIPQSMLNLIRSLGPHSLLTDTQARLLYIQQRLLGCSEITNILLVSGAPGAIIKYSPSEWFVCWFGKQSNSLISYNWYIYT